MDRRGQDEKQGPVKRLVLSLFFVQMLNNAIKFLVSRIPSASSILNYVFYEPPQRQTAMLILCEQRLWID